jgi:NodT family efflux transporter outer membrane factor (OMF) lipoprotein
MRARWQHVVGESSRVRGRATCHVVAPQPGSSRNSARLGFSRLRLLAIAAFFLCGCTSFRDYVANGFKVGPQYGPPPAPVAANWIDANLISEADKRVRRPSDDLSAWWKVFNDPILDTLICYAYQQNLTLRQAGWRVLEARAQRGIAIGELLPQNQNFNALYSRNANSLKEANRSNISKRFIDLFGFNFHIAWELDFWGRFRRAVEAATDNLDASVEEYDDVLVTLLGDLASNYVTMRTFEQRIKYAENNVKLQKETLKIVVAKVKTGARPELDEVQARSVLAETEATIPEFQLQQRQAMNQICILLGIPPEDLQKKLAPGPIPTADPEEILGFGIPADLLRRRPDIRRAERQAAAQCALIGVAESDLYPHITLNGTLGYSAAQFKDLFGPKAMNGTVGPSVQWDLFNYGRFLNNIRFRNATFQEFMTAYQSVVLRASKEVEDGLVTYFKAQQRTEKQGESVKYAERAEAIVRKQFDALVVDYTRVTQIQQNLVQQQDILAQAQGEIALGLIQTYRALGGGWQIRLTGCETSVELNMPNLGPPSCIPPPRPVRPR